MSSQSEEKTELRARTLPLGKSGRRALVLYGAIVVVSMAVGLYMVAQVVRKQADANLVWRAAQEALSAGQIDEAEKGLRALRGLREPTAADRALSAQVDLARDRIEPALETLASIPDDHELAAQARLMAARVELRRHRARFAEQLFREAIRLDPRLVAAHKELIYIYGYQLRRTDLAAEFLALSRLTDLTFQNVFDWCLLRNSFWEPTTALPELTLFIEADPEDRWSRLALGDELRRLGRLQEAADAVASLPADDPKVQAFQVMMAIDRHEYEQAEQILEKGPADDPDLARLRGRLALARHDVEGAVRSFQIAYDKMPEDHDSLFGLINALSLKGDEKALAPLKERAKALDQVNSLVQRASNTANRSDQNLVKQLGAACAAAKLFPEARAWYKLAIEANPLDEEAQQALYRIEPELK